MFDRPARLMLVNLDYEWEEETEDQALDQMILGSRSDRIEAQFNPEEFSLGIGAVYKDQTIPGMSHMVKQFSHTKNLSLSFELHWHVHAPLEASDHFPRLSIEERRRVEGFFLSLTVPRGGDALLRNRPPSVLVVWPQCLTFQGVVTECPLKYTRFNREGAPVQLSATVTMEELRDLRYTSRDARMMGLNRSSRRA